MKKTLKRFLEEESGVLLFLEHEREIEVEEVVGIIDRRVIQSLGRVHVQDQNIIGEDERREEDEDEEVIAIPDQEVSLMFLEEDQGVTKSIVSLVLLL